MADFGDSSDVNNDFSYRKPFYQKLKQLNTDICTFMVQSKGTKFVKMSPKGSPYDDRKSSIPD